MRIGMICAWNSNSGASIHAELVGRAWVEMGHELSVFSFYPYSFHGTALVNEDESYVTRCFTTSTADEVRFDPRPLLAAQYEVFVVQDHGMIPNDPLGKIFHRIRKRAKTVAVIHDGKLSEDPSFYQFPWDAVVAFDDRYRSFLAEAYWDEKIVEVPYPAYPLVPGDMSVARARLGLPAERKIILLFGPAAASAVEAIPALNDLCQEDANRMILLVTEDEEALQGFRAARNAGGLRIEIREEAPGIQKLYDYLYASDALLLHKYSAGHAVISSTVFQCLGSGCPIVALDSNYLYPFRQGEVLIYRDLEGLKAHLRDALSKGEGFARSRQAVETFLAKNNATEVARRFIELFGSL
jgi:hypothetical protein